MATYNGERYLEDQLNSFLAQTRFPDELVVCDDGSSDDSMQILEAFRRKAPFSVEVCRNNKSLGSTKNFEKAIQLCTGDIVFLSDQDDVWVAEKIERVAREFANHPEAGYVFSDALVVDDLLQPLGYTMWDREKFTRLQRELFSRGRQLEVLTKHNVVTGTAMAFRSDRTALFCPIPENWVHDGWIALIASAAGGGGRLIDDCLVKYRQHSEQLIGGRRIGLTKQLQIAKSTGSDFYGEEKERFVNAMERLRQLGNLAPKVALGLGGKIAHLEARQQLYRGLGKGGFVYFSEVAFGRYRKYSSGWRSAAKDLIALMRQTSQKTGQG